MVLNILFFLAGFAILAKSSELVMNGVENFSNSSKISKFASSFFILGILTSLSEMSVGLNAVIEKKPEVFVGNLIGASFVIMMLIIPLLAIFNKGVNLKDHLSPAKLACFLILIISPSLILLDGLVTYYDALLLLFLCGAFFYMFQKDAAVLDNLKAKKNKKELSKSILKIAIGAVLIFVASKLLVDSTIYFAAFFGVPSFLVSLIVLSVGTNIPELTIAFKSVNKKVPEIAFGDYIGSSTVNVLLFGLLTLLHGPFAVAASGFDITFFILIIGYTMFFVFGRTKSRISPLEGLILLLIYLVFLAFQATEIFILSAQI
ncbi:MAG: sodium:calcium antiporter [Candidatus Altimarinota bacterium]